MTQQRDLDYLEAIRCGRDPVRADQAKEELIRKYLPMVRHIVRNHHSQMLDFEDCFQEATIGLLRAVIEYDPSRFQIKFSTFAYICILRKVYNVLKRVYCKKAAFSNRALSFHRACGEEEGSRFANLAALEGDEPFKEIERRWIQERLDLVLKAYLSPVEYRVVQLIVTGYKFSEIQTQLSLSGKAVDNARTRARAKLRKIIKQYGSLLSPQIPLKTRKRKDLTIRLEVG